MTSSHFVLDEPAFRALFDLLPDAVLVADAAGNYIDVNSAATRLLGYSHSEFLERRVTDVVARTPAWTEAEYQRFVARGEWRDEIELRRQDGTLVVVDAHASVISRPEGQVYVSVLRETTERRLLERERTRLASIVESSNDSIIARTLDGTITSWNAGAQRLYGYSASEAVGSTLDALLPERSRR